MRRLITADGNLERMVRLANESCRSGGGNLGESGLVEHQTAQHFSSSSSSTTSPVLILVFQDPILCYKILTVTATNIIMFKISPLFLLSS